MKCPECPLSGPCRGEQIPHKCNDPRYREYFVRRSKMPYQAGQMEAGKSQHPHILKSPRGNFPTLTVRIRNFARSLLRWAQAGFPIAIREERMKRIKICGECPYKRKGYCTQCGCFIAVKSAFQTEVCPLNYWGDQSKSTSLGCGCNKG